jgi:hypothetical protein
MSNSRTRRRTKGAFGNNKPRSIEREFTPKQAPAPAGPHVPTFADKLAQFSQPILEQAGNNRTAAKGAMNVAILIWNAAIEGEAKIEEAKKKLVALPGADKEQVDELVTTMLARKQELFPEESHLVTNFALKFNHRTGTTFRVSAVNVSPEGVTKGKIKDIIQPSL